MKDRLVSAHRWSLFIAVTGLLGVMLLAPLASEARPLPTGAVSGTVFNQAGKPVSGVTVIPHVWSYAGPDWWVWEAVPGATAVTGRNGSYTLKLPAGTYRILFAPANLKQYAIEAYPNAPAADFGDDILVRYGATTRRVNAILDPPAHIEGTVRDAGSGEPVSDINVQCIFQGVSRINSLASAMAVSGQDGHYEVWGLKPYPGFSLDTSDTRQPEQYWGPWYQSRGDFTGTQQWPAGVRYGDILVERTDLAKLTGTVRDRTTQQILVGARVNLYEMWPEGGWGQTPFLSTTTGDEGTFAFTAGDLRLAPAEYNWPEWVLVEFRADGYYDVWYDRAPFGYSAQPVTAALGQTAGLGSVEMVSNSEPYPW